MNKQMLKATPEQLRARQELRRSGAAGKHDSRPRRQRTRGSAKRNAIRESW